MATSNFYEDRRYCRTCGLYVHYLQSPFAAYCSNCGTPVRLFSPPDFERFQSALRDGRPGRPGGPRSSRDRRASA